MKRLETATGWSEQSSITKEIEKTTAKKVESLRSELTTCKRDLNDDVDEDDQHIKSLSSENVALRGQVAMLEKMVSELRECVVFCLVDNGGVVEIVC